MKMLLMYRATNILYATLTLFAMSSLLSLLGWAVAGGLGVIWVLFLGALVLVFSVKLSTSSMLRFYGAAPLSASRFSDLHSAVDLLAVRANLPVRPGLFYVRGKIPNAFAIGSKSHPAVVVTDGLLSTLNLREMVGVIAHEIGHIKGNDVWLLRFADILGRLTAWFSIIGQLLLVLNLPLIIVGGRPIPWLAVILLIVSPTVSKLLQLALARSKEFDADLDGISMSGDPLGLVSALRKMKSDDSGLVERVLGKRKNRDRPSLWRTHPHTSDRIDRIMSLLHQSETGQIPSRPSHLDTLNSGIQWCHDNGC